MRLLIILCSLLFLSCSEKNCHCDVDQHVQFFNDSVISNYYESPLLLPSRYYFQLDEPNIYLKPYDVARLELRRVPGGQGEIYRLEKKLDSYELIKKVIIPATVVGAVDSIVVSKEDGDAFFELLERECYHMIPSDILDDDEIINGVLNILEINRMEEFCGLGRFHFIQRKAPEVLESKNEEFLIISRALVKLAGE